MIDDAKIRILLMKKAWTEFAQAANKAFAPDQRAALDKLYYFLVQLVRIVEKEEGQFVK